MQIIAQPESCFSSKHILKNGERACGSYRSRMVSETIDVELFDRQRLSFQRAGFFTRAVELLDAAEGRVIATAAPAGLFTSAWNVQVPSGELELVRDGLLSRAYQIAAQGQQLGLVRRENGCGIGWVASLAHGELALRELVFIGLIYRTIEKRRQRRRNHSSPGGGA